MLLVFCQLYALYLFNKLIDYTYLIMLKVDEKSEDSGKLSFVNFKRRVWHSAMSKIVECFKKLSQFGLTVKCADNIVRRFYPYFDILAGDYEEQYVFPIICYYIK